MRSLLAVLGSRNRNARAFEVGVSHGERVARCGIDGEPEEVADSADVAADGVDLLQDAVFAQCLGSEGGVLPRELSADRDKTWRAAPRDEWVWVDAARPGPVAMIKPGSEADEDGTGQGDVPAVKGESSVNDVGEFELDDLLGSQGVEGDQSDGQRDSSIKLWTMTPICWNSLSGWFV